MPERKHCTCELVLCNETEPLGMFPQGLYVETLCRLHVSVTGLLSNACTPIALLLACTRSDIWRMHVQNLPNLFGLIALSSVF